MQVVRAIRPLMTIRSYVGGVGVRHYSDRFSERENAYENKYIREQEMKKVQALQKALEEAKLQVKELEDKIKTHNAESSGSSESSEKK